VRELRFFGKRKPRSHRKANRRALTVVSRQPRTPAVVHAVETLPSLPPGTMPQRTVELPKLPPRTAPTPMPSRAELDEAAKRLTSSFSGHFRLKGNVPLFRDDMTLDEFDEQRTERLRRLQDLSKAWPDAHGVNFGDHHGPKTLVFSTADYERFNDGTDTIPAVKR